MAYIALRANLVLVILVTGNKPQGLFLKQLLGDIPALVMQLSPLEEFRACQLLQLIACILSSGYCVSFTEACLSAAECTNQLFSQVQAQVLLSAQLAALQSVADSIIHCVNDVYKLKRILLLMLLQTYNPLKAG